MAAPKRFPDNVLSQAERFIQVHTQPNGQVDLTVAENSLFTWMSGNQQALQAYARRIAYDAIRAVDVARRPQPNQPSFFDPDALLPIAQNTRVRMGQARQADVLAWWGIEMEEINRSMQAHQVKAHWLQSRMAAWQPGQTLEDVERQAFGWHP